MDKKINLKTLRVQMLEKETDQFQETMAYFDYMGKQVNKPVYVSKQKNANQKYYIDETKKIIAKENESGELFKYTRWYLNGGHNRNKLVLGICAGLVVAAGLGVGGYFIGKSLTGGSVKVTFNANSDELHLACFDNDPNKTTYTVNVAKGSSFADVKKMANPIRHEPVDGKASINGKVYDTLKQWKLGGELVNDNFKINKDVTFDAAYKRDTVTVTVLAAGNGSGFIPTGSENPGDTLTSYVRKVEYANIEKGTTLDKVLRIGGTDQAPIYFEPGMMDANHQVMADSGFRCFYDYTKEREVYETENKHDYKEYVIEEDTVLESYYESAGAYVDSLNVTLNATVPFLEAFEDMGPWYVEGSFVDGENKFDCVTIGIIEEGEVTYSWNQIVEKMAGHYTPGVNDPVGKYAGFNAWMLNDGTILIGEETTKEKFSRDFSVYAYYKPDFEKDTWGQVCAIAELGITSFMEAYEYTNNDLLSLQKSVKLKSGETVNVRAVGVGSDVTEKGDGCTTGTGESSVYYAGRTALTFEFASSVANMQYGAVSNQYYKQSAIANYLANFEEQIDDPTLIGSLKTVYKVDGFSEYPHFYQQGEPGQYKFFIPSAGELGAGRSTPSYTLANDCLYAKQDSDSYTPLRYQFFNQYDGPRAHTDAWVRGMNTNKNLLYVSGFSSIQPLVDAAADTDAHNVYPMFSIGNYGVITMDAK